MRRILILTGRYLPGYKDGGPVRSILNLTEWFGEEYDLRIMCLDRDHGDEKPYSGIRIKEYNTVGNAKVWYTPSFTEEDITALSKDADVVYSCGPYNDYARIAMKLKRSGKITAPLFVASMGSFSPEAFKIKGLKKRLFVEYMKLTGMFKDITWSVTSEREAQELRAIVGKNAKCIIAEDLARKESTPHNAVKEEGRLKIIFLSRISRKKNLIVVPDILANIGSDYKIDMDIYGYPEDKEYLDECIEKFRKLPKNIKWEYKGELDSDAVPKVFADYDAFLFPTLGENYGHVIAEALAAGCVPVISDTTPWLDFESKGCGYVRSLDELGSFTEAISDLARMSSEEYKEKSEKCYKYINSKNEEAACNSGYRVIFDI